MKTVTYSLLYLFLILFIYSCSANGSEDEVAPLSKDLNKEAVLKSATITANAKPVYDCELILENKCFGGADIILDPNVLVTKTDIENFCSDPSNSCNVKECTERILVIIGYVAPGRNGKSSCLPLRP